MKLVDLSLEEFARELGGDSPAPGGGSVAALAGALGAALCAMVASLTVGRKKYQDAWEDMENVRTRADDLSARLLSLVDKDTAAYSRVTAAFKLPKDDESQKEARKQALQAAFTEAASVPLETLRAVSQLAALAKTALDKGNTNCITDAGVAVQLMRAAANGAAYNVRINLGSLADESLAAELLAETKELMSRIEAEATELEGWVERDLS